MSATTDDLEALAAEEMAAAVDLDWDQLAPLTPWGDVYTAITPANMTVQVARNYLWAGEAGGDILAEVRVYLDEAHYEFGPRRATLIRRGAKPGARQRP